MAGKAKSKGKTRQKGVREQRYTEKMLYEERELGLYWYSGLWKVLRPVLILVCALAIVGGLVSTGWRKVYGEFLSPVDPADTEERQFVIESGSSVTTVGKDLYEQGFLRNRGIFGYIIQFRGLTNSIQYGTYELSPSMNVMEVIDVLSSGSVTTERTIRIIPGWTVENIAAYLVDEGALKDPEEFLALCNSPETFMEGSYALQQAQASGGFAGRIYALEGYLAPDTYQIFTNASAQSIIRKLLGQTDKVVDRILYTDQTEITYDQNGEIVEVGDQRTKYVGGLTQEQMLILASMIEREAGRKEDYGRVAAVFYNRLKQGMRLESDATITYVLRLNKLNLTGEELALNSPYNTYAVSGLPVGPICNPSAAAIEAAVYPDMEYINDGYLYFCSKEPESGELAFARTYEEHQRNVETYRPSWIEYDQRQNQQ